MTVLEPGTTFADKYLIDGVLGKGGMGAVYSATNQSIGRRVAIKVLVADLADRDDIKARFSLEARAAAVINHPGIVDVLDMGETEDGEPFIVMEHLEGATLKAVFRKHGVFAPEQAVGVLVPLLDALAAAHQANVIHRDIKPANVFLCTKPQRLVKLLDFGISRFGQSTGLTHSGTAVGTPKYMAPEQVLGEKTIGPSADLYSVGALLYELLGGRAPYDADSDIATLAKLLKEEHQPLMQLRPDLPAQLCDFVDALLVKEPERRAKDAAKVKESLLALVKAGELSSLFDIAQDAAVRSQSGGTPRPPTGPARLPATSPGRRNSVNRMPAAQVTLDDDAPATRPSAKRGPARTPRTPPPVVLNPTAPALEPVGDPPRRSGVMAAAVIVTVGLVGGASLFRVLGKTGQAPAAPVVVETPPKPSTPQDSAPVKTPANALGTPIVVTLAADPASARFEVDGEKLDGNPVTLTREQGSEASIVTTAQGFEPRSFLLVFTESREERVTLTLVAAVAPATADPADGNQPRNTRSGTRQPPPPIGKKSGKLTVDETNPYE